MGKRLYKNWNVYFFQVSINYNFSHAVRWEVQCGEAYRIQNSNRAALYSATGTFQRSNLGKKEV